MERPDTPRLGDLVPHLRAADEGRCRNDAAAWFNLGLAHAWLGNNAAALEALRSLRRVGDDENAAGEAAALMEGCAAVRGRKNECDYQEHVFGYQFRDPQPVVNLLQEWDRGGRLVALPTQQEGMFMGLVLELNTAGLITVGAPPADAGRLGGYVVIVGNLFQVHQPLEGTVRPAPRESPSALVSRLTELQERRAPIQFQDVMAEALLFPLKRDGG